MVLDKIINFDIFVTPIYPLLLSFIEYDFRFVMFYEL